MPRPVGVPLSPEDRAILALEGPDVVGHTCKVVVLGQQAPTVAELRRSLERRVGGTPRLTWRLGGSPAAPEWVPDDAFDVEAHIGQVPVSGELDAAALRAEVARLFARRLDRDRPLWRIDVVGPLVGGGTALVWRIHHALADGTTAMALAEGLLWDEPATPVPGAAGGTPRHDTDADETRRRHHLAGLLEREFLPNPWASPFDASVGADRDVAFAETTLSPLLAAARTLASATLNDAVLAVVAGALRTWLQHRGAPVHSLRAKVPVSLHHEGKAVGNLDSYFCVRLPLRDPDPVGRLRTVRAETAVRKAQHDAQEMAELLDELGRSAPRLRRWCSDLQAGPRAFALNVSNVPGPRRAVGVLGAPVEAIHSLAEVGKRHALRIAVVSLDDKLCFGLCADRSAIDDLAALAGAVAHEADLLVATAAE